ncbi:MAG: hypothetical protein NC821_05605, partial [Candidatus Omnitrophica bacterium]|nr:hypothetical protein [Candidatus Omnitrophota bacterium]
MKSFLSLLCIVMISAGIAGCASPQLKKPSAVDTAENRALVDKLLEAIISSYINYSRDDFSQLVADDFLPLKTEFLNEVEK